MTVETILRMPCNSRRCRFKLEGDAMAAFPPMTLAFDGLPICHFQFEGHECAKPLVTTFATRGCREFLPNFAGNLGLVTRRSRPPPLRSTASSLSSSRLASCSMAACQAPLRRK